MRAYAGCYRRDRPSAWSSCPASQTRPLPRAVGHHGSTGGELPTVGLWPIVESARPCPLLVACRLRLETRELDVPVYRTMVLASFLEWLWNRRTSTRRAASWIRTLSPSSNGLSKRRSSPSGNRDMATPSTARAADETHLSAWMARQRTRLGRRARSSVLSSAALTSMN